MGSSITPNMNLVLANPAGTASPEPGPQYATDNNQSFTILDSHNHSPGSGVQITPLGMNINTNLSFQNNQATNVYGIQFSNPLANSTSLTFLYTAPQSGGGINDLFYNDGAGNVIALTKAGLVNATIASLPGESYAGGTFTWVQGNGSTTPANFDIGAITIRPNTAGTTNGVVVGPPSAISSQYNIFLPILPGSTSFTTIDSSGNMSSIPLLGSLTNSNLSSSAGILGTQIASQTITQSNLAARSTGTTVGAGGVALSTPFGTTASSGTIGSVTITTTGRPVYVGLMCAQGVTGQITLTASAIPTFVITNGSTGTILSNFTNNISSSGAMPILPAGINAIDISVNGLPATYTYTASWSGSGNVTLAQIQLIAYEI
jgi:hypothetical protein